MWQFRKYLDFYARSQDSDGPCGNCIVCACALTSGTVVRDLHINRNLLAKLGLGYGQVYKEILLFELQKALPLTHSENWEGQDCLLDTLRFA